MAKKTFTEIVEKNNFRVVNLDNGKRFCDFIIQDTLHTLIVTGSFNKETSHVGYDNICGTIGANDLQNLINIKSECEGEE